MLPMLALSMPKGGFCEQLYRCTVLSVNGKHPLRLIESLSLYGFVCHLERIVHLDGSDHICGH